MFGSRALAALVIGTGVMLGASISHAAQVAQAQETPQPLPQDVVSAITQSSCDSAALDAVVKQQVAAHQDLAGDIAGLAVSRCPGDAADVAATAASASPTQVAAILIAVIEALPPGQQENAAPGIVAALENAVPEAGAQITSAITQLAFNPGPNLGTGGRSNIGAPLVAPHTDPPSSQTTTP
ncbi:MAG TPA: hypothetical protein VMU06_01555 [Stellaceae bacterium]|nr:hypothetical protein [Stellaceae bacterium]